MFTLRTPEQEKFYQEQKALQQLGKYDRICYNVPERQSCKFHFHLQLEVLKD